MQVHPDIAALRGNHAPQRQAQAALNEARKRWLAEDGAAALMDELVEYGRGAPLEACEALATAFTAAGEAERLLGLLAGHYCHVLARHPLGQPTFRNGFDGIGSSLLLARSGRAQLMLQAREPGELGLTSYNFSDATRFDAVLAGEAKARIVRSHGRTEDRTSIAEERVTLRPGHRIALDLSQEMLVIDRVERRLVVLRLLRRDAEPRPVREYDPADGRLIHQSAGQIATSRQEAMIALLGRMGRTDAALAIAAVATGAGEDSLRWQALREALALDTATGFRALTQVARQADDPLARHAGALRAQLLEAHPQLAQLEDDQCPA